MTTSAAGEPATARGIGEVAAGHADVILDQADRPVDLTGRRQRVGLVEDEVRVGVRSDRDAVDRRQLGETGPADRPAVVGKHTLAVDKVGGHVEGGWEATPSEAWCDVVHPIGGAVVERQHDSGASAVVVSGGGRPAEAGDRVGQSDHPCGRGEDVELLVERVRRQIYGGRRSSTDAVIGEHDERLIVWPRQRVDRAPEEIDRTAVGTSKHPATG